MSSSLNLRVNFGILGMGCLIRSRYRLRLDGAKFACSRRSVVRLDLGIIMVLLFLSWLLVRQPPSINQLRLWLVLICMGDCDFGG